MSLENYTPVESSEWWSQSTEISEKFKESYKKSTSWIKRTRKDEKKSKKYDLLLAWFLVKIIIDKKYDWILNDLFKCSNYWYPSNFLLWILSLINNSISDNIRDISWKEKIIYNYKSENELKFDDNSLPIEVKNRINKWIEDITDVVSIEHSMITTKHLLTLFKEKDLILNYTSIIFTFFLKESNIIINDNISQNISDFILKQIVLEIKKLKIEEI